MGKRVSIPLLIVFLGMAVRAALLFQNHSLWLDEAYLALNILHRDFLGFLQPLEFQQMAPIGFLFCVKSFSLLFGNHEIILRLVPWLSGILGILLFWKLTRPYFPGTEAIPLFLFCFAAQNLEYSTELKQYSFELSVTLLLWLAIARAQFFPSFASWLGVAIGGILAPLFSFSSIFVIQGFLFPTLLEEYWKKKKIHNGALISIVLSALAFVLMYTLYIQPRIVQSTSTFHAESMAPFPPRSFADFKWYYAAYLAIFENPGGFEFRFTGLVFFLFLIGQIDFFRKHPWTWLFLNGPLFLTFSAAILGKYPFTGRLLLFLSPFLWFFLAQGITLLWESLDRQRFVVVVLLAYLAQSFLISGFQQSFHSRIKHQELRPALEYVSSNIGKEDRVYFYCYTAVPYRYYKEVYQFSFPQETTGTHPALPESMPSFLQELTSLKYPGPQWLLFSHIFLSPGERTLLEARISELGTIREKREFPGVWIYKISPDSGSHFPRSNLPPSP